ncbi:hypothetical protein MAR_012004 [Mya arenaria]|uniref:Uncharacterized protein n=1 Tax=Mya arenaria TaxID=6604 RepID=A0ABY7FVT7_MYAAR|nr:hypothetical protein MAR_012004 [Mya arenaria]
MWTAYGGQSSHSTGGAGTVYVGAISKKLLYVDNKKPYSVPVSCDVYDYYLLFVISGNIVLSSIDQYDVSGIADMDYGRTWITFPTSGSMVVDKLYLFNGAHLALEPAANPASADYKFETEGFYGKDFGNDANNLGTIHVGPYQTFTVRAIDLYFPAHAEVYESGLLSMPSKVKWFNSQSNVHGTIGGVTELTLVRSTLNLMATSKTLGSSFDARFTISTLNIMADGVLNMTEDIQYHMILSNLNIAPAGRIEGSDLIIETTNVKVEEGGVINLSERGDIKMGDGMWAKYLQIKNKSNTANESL